MNRRTLPAEARFRNKRNRPQAFPERIGWLHPSADSRLRQSSTIFTSDGALL